MLKYQLQREDYWIKTVHPYGLNKRTKIVNKDSPQGKLFPPFPRYSKRFIDTWAQSKIPNHFLSFGLKYYWIC